MKMALFLCITNIYCTSNIDYDIFANSDTIYSQNIHIFLSLTPCISIVSIKYNSTTLASSNEKNYINCNHTYRFPVEGRSVH